MSGCETRGSEELAGAQSPIIGGKLDTTHKGVVSLLKEVPAGQGQGFYPACSGTLITQNLVLTARHCVSELTSSDGSVECPTTKFKPPAAASTMLVSIEANVGQEGLTPFRVNQVWVPPGDTAVCGNDIALVQLSGSGVPADAATTIEPRIASPVPANDKFSAIGYGLQDPNDQLGTTAGHRMAVSTATVYCQGADCGTPMVIDDEFAAESPVCSGDSGGPALDSAGRVAGVTSRGDQECTLGIYSSVAAWRDFIVEKTFEAAKNGNYAPPLWAGDPPPGFETGGGGAGGAPSTGGSGGMGGTSGSAGSGIVIAGTGPTPSGGSGAGGKAGSSGGQAGMSRGGSNDSPTIDPLGTPCTGQCLGDYKCWAESGKPPGICVPACSASQNSCPSGYSCDTSLNACTTAHEQAQANDSGGCSLSRKPSMPFSGLWLGLSLVAMQAARRGAKRRAAGRAG